MGDVDRATTLGWRESLRRHYKQKHEDLPRITSLRPRVPANLLFAIEGALKKEVRPVADQGRFLEELTYNPPPVLAQPYPPGEGPIDNAPTVQFRPATLLADELVDAATAHAVAESGADLQDDVAAPIPAPASLEAAVEPAPFIPSDPNPLTIAVTPVDFAEPIDTTHHGFPRSNGRHMVIEPAFWCVAPKCLESRMSPRQPISVSRVILGDPFAKSHQLRYFGVSRRNQFCEHRAHAASVSPGSQWPATMSRCARLPTYSSLVAHQAAPVAGATMK